MKHFMLKTLVAGALCAVAAATLVHAQQAAVENASISGNV